MDNKITKSFPNRNKFYFYGVENIDYNFRGDRDKDYIITIKNILHRFDFLNNVKNSVARWNEWIIKDGETPESIAKDLYKTPHLYWIVIVLNDIIDPLFSWPLTDTQLFYYITEIYGSDKREDIHHYEADEDGNVNAYPEGTIVDSSYPYNILSISNYEYEKRLNESKRNIKLLRPEVLGSVLYEFYSIQKSNFRNVTRNI